MKTSAAVTGALIGWLVLTSCGSSGSATEPDDLAVDEPTATADPSSQTPSDGSMPTEVAPPEGPVVGTGTVLDEGDSDAAPQLCLGLVAASAPPQCEGPPLTQWSWDQVPGTYGSNSGTRWGSYAVTGIFDGVGFSVTEKPQPLALYDGPAPEPEPEDRFATPCATPEDGWAVIDQARISYADQDAAISEALQLPGYAGSFLAPLKSAADNTRKPENASQSVLNVLVTEDVDGARTRLEAIWGGPLCVAEAERSEQDLLAIQGELGELPGLLSSGIETDRVTAQVVWDDGALQEWADATYGAGAVEIQSAFDPAD